jgi:hypothetical protein
MLAVTMVSAPPSSGQETLNSGRRNRGTECAARHCVDLSGPGAGRDNYDYIGGFK